MKICSQMFRKLKLYHKLNEWKMIEFDVIIHGSLNIQVLFNLYGCWWNTSIPNFGLHPWFLSTRHQDPKTSSACSRASSGPRLLWQWGRSAWTRVLYVAGLLPSLQKTSLIECAASPFISLRSSHLSSNVGLFVLLVTFSSRQRL